MPSEPADVVARPGREDDLEQVAAMFSATRRAAVPAMPPPVHTPEEDRGWLAEQLAGQVAGDRETWVAEVSGRIVGLLLLEGGRLHSLYVDPGHQSRGIGTMLVDLAKSLRPRGLELWVFETNTAAQRLYAREGFVAVQRTDGAANEEQAPDIRMVWPGAR